MARKHPQKIQLNHKWEPIVDFDGDGIYEIDESSENSDAGAVSLPQNKATHSHLLLLALLEQMCSQYEADPNTSRKLFMIICKKLTQMKILSNISCTDELASVRSHYKLSLLKLFDGALNYVNKKCKKSEVVHFKRPVDAFLEPKLGKHYQLGVVRWEDLLNTHTSRYREEFVEIGKLGRGAYGTVFKARHKLDGCCYAIKKIAFQDINKSICIKTLREVKYLASLRHENIVQYHGAWMEYQVPIISDSSSHSNQVDHWQQNGNVPALEYKLGGSSSSSDEEGAVEDVEATDSIIFEESQSKHGYPSEDEIDSLKEKRKSQRFRRSLSSGDAPYGQGGVAFGKQYEFHSADSFSKCSFIQNAFVMLYIQMEACSHTLSEWLKERNSMPNLGEGVYSLVKENFSLSILRGLLKAVQYIHDQNIIHRDIKPKNIFMSQCADGQPKIKLGDFGLARYIHVSSVPPSPLTPNPGFLPDLPENTENAYTQGIGTTIYAAPEQLTGPVYSKKCDMYSVGLVMFELYQPFSTEMERYHDLMDLRKGKLTPEFITHWPVQQKITMNLVSHDPTDRPTASELLAGELFLNKDQIIRKLRDELLTKDLELASLSQRLKELEKNHEKLKNSKEKHS